MRSSLSKAEKLVEILKAVRGTLFGLSFWALFWVWIAMPPAKEVDVFLFSIFFGLFWSFFSLILGTVHKKWMNPLTFVAISPWIALSSAFLWDWILEFIRDRSIRAEYPFTTLLLVLILAFASLASVFLEYRLTKRIKKSEDDHKTYNFPQK